MSEENVEIVRRVYKVAEARGVEGLLELATDDIVWISDSRFPGGGTYVGRENVLRWLNKIWIYAEVSVDVEEIIDLDDRALGITRFHGVYSDAPPVDWPWCHLFWFRDGLISQAQSFFDRGSPRSRWAVGVSRGPARGAGRVASDPLSGQPPRAGLRPALAPLAPPLSRELPCRKRWL